jgi:hypothetical protein
MADSTFADTDVTTFARLDGLGLQVLGQFLESDRAIRFPQKCRWPRRNLVGASGAPGTLYAAAPRTSGQPGRHHGMCQRTGKSTVHTALRR